MDKENFDLCLDSVGLSKKQFSQLTGIAQRTVYGWDKTPAWVDTWILNYSSFKDNQYQQKILSHALQNFEDYLDRIRLSNVLEHEYQTLPYLNRFDMVERQIAIAPDLRTDFIYTSRKSKEEICFVTIATSINHYLRERMNPRKILLYPEARQYKKISYMVVTMEGFKAFEKEFFTEFINEALRSVDFYVVYYREFLRDSYKLSDDTPYERLLKISEELLEILWR